MLVVLAGLPGVGKSTLARMLAALTGADVVDKDRLRDAIFPPADIDYSDAQNALATDVAYMVIAYMLARDPTKTIVLDGKPFSRERQREEARAVAVRAGSAFLLVHCVAPDEIVRARLEAEAARDPRTLAADRTFAKYLRIKRVFEPIAMPHVIIDTAGDLEHGAAAVLRSLREPDGAP